MADYGRLVFSDNFTRTNSATVGNGWTEAGSGGYDANTISVESNQMKMGNSEVSETYCQAYQTISDSGLVYPIEFYSAIKITGANWLHLRSASVALNGSGMNVKLSDVDNEIVIQNGTSAVSTQATTINDGTTYHVWCDVVKNGSNFNVAVYFSSSSTKPGSPTVSCTNQSFSGTGDRSGFATNDNRTNTSYVDSFAFYDSRVDSGALFFSQI